MKTINTKQSSIAVKSPRKGFSLETRRMIIGFLLILPALASILVFKYLPFVLGISISFFDFDIVNMPGTFIGLKNFIRVFQDPRFYTSLGHNLKFLLYALAMNFWVPIFWAILMNEIRRGKTLLRTIYYIPACAPAIAMSIIWKYFWQPDYGLANALIGMLGIEPQLWLSDPKLVYFCFHFPGIIGGGGMAMVLYLANLQNVPGELYEAAVIDGANVWQRIRHISLPGISNFIFLQFTLALIGQINAMQHILIMTSGGPAGSTETVLLYAYKMGIDSMDYSYAMTVITIVFTFTMILNIIMTNIRNRRD